MNGDCEEKHTSIQRDILSYTKQNGQKFLSDHF